MRRFCERKRASTHVKRGSRDGVPSRRTEAQVVRRLHPGQVKHTHTVWSAEAEPTEQLDG